MNSQNVYVGQWGTYIIPDDVMQKVIAMNNGKLLADRRTKGSRYLEWWGRCQDSTQETALAIKKRLPELNQHT